MPRELTFALESANALRYALDRTYFQDGAEQTWWVRCEAEMLQYLAWLMADGEAEYPSLAAGLADYAVRMQNQVDFE